MPLQKQSIPSIFSVKVTAFSKEEKTASETAVVFCVRNAYTIESKISAGHK